MSLHGHLLVLLTLVVAAEPTVADPTVRRELAGGAPAATAFESPLCADYLVATATTEGTRRSRRSVLRAHGCEVLESWGDARALIRVPDRWEHAPLATQFTFQRFDPIQFDQLGGQRIVNRGGAVTFRIQLHDDEPAWDGADSIVRLLPLARIVKVDAWAAGSTLTPSGPRIFFTVPASEVEVALPLLRRLESVYHAAPMGLLKPPEWENPWTEYRPRAAPRASK